MKFSLFFTNIVISVEAAKVSMVTRSGMDEILLVKSNHKPTLVQLLEPFA